ncbi:MAG: M12 family metallopeptidase [Cypionkella sp.]
MPRRILASTVLILASFAAQAQDETLADAADELRFLEEGRPTETATLRLDGSIREITFVTDDAGQAIYQGDIVLGSSEEIWALSNGAPLTLEGLEAEGFELHGLVAARSTAIWPGGKVPYIIDASVPTAWVPRIRNAIAHWEDRTSIRFNELDTAAGTYVLFYDDPSQNNCQSPIGRKTGGGAVKIQLADWCKWGNVAHEIGHALGLHHEQARTDRDLFINVSFSAAATDTTKFQFKQDAAKYTDLGPYCYDSIMHYPVTGNAGTFTISAKATPQGEATGNTARIGQRSGLSDCDVDTIQRYYGFAPMSDTAPDLIVNDVPAADANPDRFTGDLVFFPAGCESARRCFLGNPLRYTDADGTGWLADKRNPDAPDTVLSGMTDGASIPEFAQSLVGKPFDPSYIKAAVIHDHYMYKENRVRGWWPVQRAFYDMLKDLGVPEAKAQIMYLGVLVGSAKWIKLVPGSSCGEDCINDIAESSPNVDMVGGVAYREWTETFGTVEYEAAMQRGLDELRVRGGQMTLGDVNLLAKELLGGHPVFSVGDLYDPSGPQDAVIAD